ncbi:MAG: helix-turn-helix transcriptional regulator [Woeseiaceae bacterium]|nr:helix-turn-helix transcriptional regulator [Woeseiaceae bacterium]
MLLESETVRSLRTGKGWTQEQLAELCDLSVRTIQRIEKTGVASLETSSALASVLEVEREDILAKGGVKPARTEFALHHLVAAAAVTFLLGIGIGVLF